MMSLTSAPEIDRAHVPVSPEEIEHQLSRMIDSRHFCHSHRYPVLLKYLVEQTLAGNSRNFKERTLGIEVFHRSPDYDTNDDPVVRVTAAEVRKRIAQYYQEPEHRDEVRIEIPIGSYAPRFSRPEPNYAPAAVEAADPLLQHPERPNEAAPRPGDISATAVEEAASSRFARHTWVIAVACLCAGVALYFAIAHSVTLYAAWHEHAVRKFWSPMTNTQLPVVVIIGDHTIGAQGNALRANQGSAVNPSEDVLQLMNEHEQVTMNDVVSLLDITSYLVRHDHSYSLLGAGSANIEDLRNNPVVLFAGLDNRWTLRLTEHLRYRFLDSPDDSTGTIVDSQDPSRHWQVDFKVPYKSMPVDYAIVARYFDPLIEQPVIVAAGLGENGTVSASEFVTSERFLEGVEKIAPKGWQSGNVELVLQCSVIDGKAAPPHIIAAQFW